MAKRPVFLSQMSTVVTGTAVGHTIFTEARPETSDEQDDGTPQAAHGSRTPWLAARTARIVANGADGKSILTRARPETSDEGDEA